MDIWYIYISIYEACFYLHYTRVIEYTWRFQFKRCRKKHKWYGCRPLSSHCAKVLNHIGYYISLWIFCVAFRSVRVQQCAHMRNSDMIAVGAAITVALEFSTHNNNKKWSSQYTATIKYQSRGNLDMDIDVWYETHVLVCIKQNGISSRTLAICVNCPSNILLDGEFTIWICK